MVNISGWDIISEVVTRRRRVVADGWRVTEYIGSLGMTEVAEMGQGCLLHEVLAKIISQILRDGLWLKKINVNIKIGSA